ncbi:hypothetical protein RvY_13156 [Ramazzottius varieornatus]|uniref:Major facilitator superfamily (MFS) profile domain-containing protein n=1 Tax=Ramazzottius varieornatus TaxID=947166 RepID=A0A1D1VLY3_RAMVA|nr:hypothetical protein RvY_13156 [Ramazzottius varieornatus]
MGQNTRKRHPDVDTGWAWASLLSAFMVQVIMIGLILSMGVFYSDILTQFNKGPVLTGWVIAVNGAMNTLVGPIGSTLSNRYGFTLVIFLGSLISFSGFFITYFANDFWLVFFCFGFLTGIGSGLGMAASFGVVAVYFDRHQRLASSVLTLGIGLGLLIFPVLNRILIEHYTWRGASLVLSAISLHSIAFSCVFVHQPRLKTSKSLADNADFSLFRKISFYIIVLHFFLLAGYSLFIQLAVRYASQNVGITAHQAVLALSSHGFFNICGRLMAIAFTSTRMAAPLGVRFWAFHVATLATAAGIIMYAWSSTLMAVLAWSGAVGFFVGVRWSFLPGIQMEILSPRRFATSFSYGLCAMGIATLIFPPLGEWIAVVASTPEAPFYLGGVCVALAGGAMILLQGVFKPKSPDNKAMDHMESVEEKMLRTGSVLL